jgi:hypothetical protein
MRAGIERLFVRDEDGFMDAADIEDFCGAELRAEDVDRAARFAVDCIRWNGNDIKRVMRDP